jgi:hypothetical protein
VLEILVFAIRSSPFEERLATTEKATRTNTSRITRLVRARSDRNSGISFAVRNNFLNTTVSGRHCARLDPNHREFVSKADIDPRYLIRPHYLVPVRANISPTLPRRSTGPAQISKPRVR